MAQFILLLHNTIGARPEMSPEEIQGIIAEYKAWSRKLQAEEREIASHKLTRDGGRIVRARRDGADGGTVVTDGPFPEAKEIIGGFFIIEANDYADAERLVADCPHLKYGGGIEIRQIEVV
jgi:hypothetical protein